MKEFPVSFTLTGKTAVIDKEFTLGGITVPVGFISDGMTTPRLFWFKYHPFSQYVPAAFVHDYCIKEFGYGIARDRLKQSLKELEARPWEAATIYLPVRFKDWIYRLRDKFKREQS